MSHPGEQICDELVTTLNSAPTGTFALRFTAEKPADPNAELDKASDAIRVLFWPHSESEKKIGRGNPTLETFSVAMLVIRKLSTEFTRERMHSVMREIKTYLRGRRMAGRVYSGAETTAVDLEQLHDRQRLAVATILTYTGTA